MRNIRFGRSDYDVLMIDQLEAGGCRGSYLRYAMRAMGIEHRSSKWSETRCAMGITNEANLTGGENVGGSLTTSAAPEASDDDDDDGDGDGDPDPEPRRRGRPRTNRNTVPYSVEHFDRLPDSAFVDVAALKALTGKSRATLYRWIDKGILPKPRKLGISHNVWTAGDIRRAMHPLASGEVA